MARMEDDRALDHLLWTEEPVTKNNWSLPVTIIQVTNVYQLILYISINYLTMYKNNICFAGKGKKCQFIQTICPYGSIYVMFMSIQ